MTCHRIPGGIICLSPFYRLPLADGTRVYMEWHSYLGPMFFLDKAAEREIIDWWKYPRIVEALTWFCNRGHKA